MAKGRRSKLRKTTGETKEAPKAYPDQIDKSHRPHESPSRDISELTRPSSDQNP